MASWNPAGALQDELQVDLSRGEHGSWSRPTQAVPSDGGCLHEGWRVELEEMWTYSLFPLVHCSANEKEYSFYALTHLNKPINICYE